MFTSYNTIPLSAPGFLFTEAYVSLTYRYNRRFPVVLCNAASFGCPHGQQPLNFSVSSIIASLMQKQMISTKPVLFAEAMLILTKRALMNGSAILYA